MFPVERLREEYPKGVTPSRKKALEATKDAIARLETDSDAVYPVELDLERARVDQNYCEYVIKIWNRLAGV